jgi:dephospho-CoA kinase
MPLSEKVKWADYVIDNSGDRSGTERAVERIYQQLRAESDGLK